MVGQYGDGPCADGDQRLERKGRGQNRLDESCEGSQSPARAAELKMMMMMMMMMTTTTMTTCQNQNTYFEGNLLNGRTKHTADFHNNCLKYPRVATDLLVYISRNRAADAMLS
jgi:hypothetical protein